MTKQIVDNHDFDKQQHLANHMAEQEFKRYETILENYAKNNDDPYVKLALDSMNKDDRDYFFKKHIAYTEMPVTMYVFYQSFIESKIKKMKLNIDILLKL